VTPWGFPRREVPLANVGLTSLLDVLVILVIFLLALVGPGQGAPPPAEALVLPTSTATAPFAGDVRVRVTREILSLDGAPLLRLERGPAGPEIPASMKEGRLVPILLDRLAARSGSTPGGTAPLLLEGDRDLPFSVLREVMYTAQKAGFQDFHFLVLGSVPDSSTGGLLR